MDSRRNSKPLFVPLLASLLSEQDVTVGKSGDVVRLSCESPEVAEQLFEELTSPQSLSPRTTWPEGLQAGERYQVRSDEGEGFLRVQVDDQGDAYVLVCDDQRNTVSSIRVCTRRGGGKSPRTRMALLWLADAMRKDGEDLDG